MGLRFPKQCLTSLHGHLAFSDGLQVAIGVIKEEAPHIRFQSARTLLENIARKIEQKLPEIVSMYMDNTAKAHGWEKKDDKGQP